MQLMAKGIHVEYQDIFDNPTPEMLAKIIGSIASDQKPETTDTSADDSASGYSEELRYNTLEYAAEVKREPLGSVLLTGAVGFLGIHILHELLESETGNILEASNRSGIHIRPVPDNEYYADYNRMLSDESVNARLQGLMNNDSPYLHAVETDNTFTANILYRLGFSWPMTDINYLERAITSLKTLGFFD